MVVKMIQYITIVHQTPISHYWLFIMIKLMTYYKYCVLQGFERDFKLIR